MGEYSLLLVDSVHSRVGIQNRITSFGLTASTLCTSVGLLDRVLTSSGRQVTGHTVSRGRAMTTKMGVETRSTLTSSSVDGFKAVQDTFEHLSIRVAYSSRANLADKDYNNIIHHQGYKSQTVAAYTTVPSVTSIS